MPFDLSDGVAALAAGLRAPGMSVRRWQADAFAASLRSGVSARHGSPPSVIADAVAKAVTAARSKTRYAVGLGAKPLITAKRLLGDRQFDALIRRATGVPKG